MNTLSTLLPLAISAAESAAREILDVYNSGDFKAEVKGDNSPLTLADKRAHHVIEQALKQTGLPLLSEEGRNIPYEDRKHWNLFWMVDPLDGTKEFLKRNGEFTVNIALIENGIPVLGVVGIPITNEIFYACNGDGAWKKGSDGVKRLSKPSTRDSRQRDVRVVASRSHMNEETEKFITTLTNPVLVSKGSSLKFLLLAEGEADIYPRFAPTMEWDTAAAHAIVKEAGLHVYQAGTTSELTYNKVDLVNPYFIVH
ncbi:MAG TPA: 3'(2'),5'-bisphosphate nucleotidase CysQ [Chryseosolibacter sp.]